MSDATAMACQHLLSLIDASAIADTPEAAEMRRQVDAIVRDDRDSRSTLCSYQEEIAYLTSRVAGLADKVNRQHELLCHARHAIRAADSLLTAYPPILPQPPNQKPFNE